MVHSRKKVNSDDDYVCEEIKSESKQVIRIKRSDSNKKTCVSIPRNVDLLPKPFMMKTYGYHSNLKCIII